MPAGRRCLTSAASGRDSTSFIAGTWEAAEPGAQNVQFCITVNVVTHPTRCAPIRALRVAALREL
jgi:hypothetical protein